MKKTFKIPSPTFIAVKMAFATINRFKTDEQKIFGFSEILKKENALLSLSIGRLESADSITSKKKKLESDIFKLAGSIKKEVAKNIKSLNKNKDCKSLIESFEGNYNKLEKLLG